MPKNPNYQNSLIYKLVCNDTDIKNIYIGSTTNFRNRKAQHKIYCYNENVRQYNTPLYMFIRANGGWDNWTMCLVDYTPCNTKLELHKVEREYIQNNNKNLLLNITTPLRTNKEWKEDNKDKIEKYYQDNKDKISEKRKEYKKANKDKILKQAKEYYQDNKDKILEKCREYRKYNKDKINEKIECDKCGKLLSKGSLKRHQQGNRCIKI